MMTQLLRLWRRNHNELRNTLIQVIFTVLVTGLVYWITSLLPDLLNLDIPQLDRFELLTTGLLSAILLTLIWNSFTFRRRITRVEQLISGESDTTSGYSYRAKHFKREKDFLCKELVERVLPMLINQYARTKNISRIEIIIDSGTTLTPTFEKLKIHGFPGVSEALSRNIMIHTNSMSGVEKFNEVTFLLTYPIEATSIHLLGGNPLEKYQATTGEATQEEIKRIATKKREGEQRLLIGIITGNWLACGVNLNNLRICANGRGHPEFKRGVVDICDVIIVVAPLGKILRVENKQELNGLLKDEPEHKVPEDDYEEIRLPDARKEHSYLLTTQRPLHAFLGQHSLFFQDAARAATNFTLLNCPRFTVSGNRRTQEGVEIPHRYLQEHPNKSRIFHLHP